MAGLTISKGCLWVMVWCDDCGWRLWWCLSIHASRFCLDKSVILILFLVSSSSSCFWLCSTKSTQNLYFHFLYFYFYIGHLDHVQMNNLRCDMCENKVVLRAYMMFVLCSDNWTRLFKYAHMGWMCLSVSWCTNSVIKQAIILQLTDEIEIMKWGFWFRKSVVFSGDEFSLTI